VAANHLPIVRGRDNGIWRRVALVPFNVKFWDADKGESGPAALCQDKRLAETLAGELSGILNWCLLGCMEWQAEGLAMPQSVIAATRDYRTDSDSIAAFLAECCVMGKAEFVSKTHLLKSYIEWCQANHEYAVNRNDFKREMITQGFTEDKFTFGRNKGNEMWRGVGLAAVLPASGQSGEPGCYPPYTPARGNKQPAPPLCPPEMF